MKTQLKTFSLAFSMMLLLTRCNDHEEAVNGSSLNLGNLSKSLSYTIAGAKPSARKLPLDSIPQDRNDLGEMRSVVKLFDGSSSAGLSVPGFGGLSLGKDEKSLSVYYIETKTVVIGKDTNVYGIGYSIHYLFKKIKKGLSVDKLPFVAASVQLDGSKTQVFYSIQSYGMIGNPLVKFFKPVINKPFDVEGFGIMQSSIDGIQNILGDTVLSKSLKFSPVLFKNIRPNEL